MPLGQFYTIYCALNREAELERLVAWAARKRLPGPQRHYARLLDDQRARLHRHMLHHPQMVRWAHVARALATPLKPRPRAYRGAAAGYRNR